MGTEVMLNNKGSWRGLLQALLLLVSVGSWSEVMAIGEALPVVELSGNAGELICDGAELRYQSWSSAQLPGVARMLYIVAARMGADKINQPLLDALEAEGGVEAFPGEQVKVVSILNVDDVFPMGGGFARAAFEHARKQPENAHAEFVLDDRSAIQRAWGLKRKSAAVIILDPLGRVVRFKDGGLTDAEIVDFVKVLKQFVKTGA